jgi:hypothetical protein
MATINLMQAKLRRSVPSKKFETAQQGNKFLYDISDKADNTRIINQGSIYWAAQQTYRDRVERCWRYRRGSQWSDLVLNPDTGGYEKEEDLIKNQGQIPFVVNMIAPLIRNYKGQFRSSNSRSTVIARTREEAPVGEMLTNTLRAVYDTNDGMEEDVAALEIFLNSGYFNQRIEYKYSEEKKKNIVKFSNVELSNLAFNNVNNRDLSDLNFIVQFHDLTIDDVVAAFAKNKSDEARVRSMYNYVSKEAYNVYDHFESDHEENKDFLYPSEQHKCRVFECWEYVGEWRYRAHDWMHGTYETVKLNPENKLNFDNINANRIMVAAQNGIPQEEVALIEYVEKYVKYWRFKYITPNMETLWAGETPYKHGSHPFVFGLHPLIRGEVWGAVEELLDIQRGFNRNWILLDFVIGSSSKGTLLVDENSISDDFNFDEICETWSKRNGVIKMKLKPGAQIPQQLVNKAIPAGLNESLQMSMQLMSSQSGVNDAIQGKKPDSGTPASRYAMEAQNSTLNSKDILDAFNSFRCRRDRKIIDVAVQFYKEKEYLPVSGQNYREDSKIFDPEKIGEDLQYELQVNQGTDSQVYRAIIDEWLNGWVEKGLLPMELMLKHTSMPFADNLLNDINEMKKEASQGQVNYPQAGVPQQAVNYLQSQGADASKANPQAIEMMNRYMRQ